MGAKSKLGVSERREIVLSKQMVETDSIVRITGVCMTVRFTPGSVWRSLPFGITRFVPAGR
jgi:hypothetical protein